VAVILAGATAAFPAAGDALRPTNALLVLEPGAWRTARELQRDLAGAGAQVRHVFWPGIAYASVPEERRDEVRAHPGVSAVHESEVEPPAGARGPARELLAVEIWNSRFAGGRILESAAEPTAARPIRDRALVPPLPATSRPAPRGSGLPFGADFYDTSEYLHGVVAVGAVLVESDGSIDPNTEDWTAGETAFVSSEIVVGCDWWATRLNSTTGLSFVYDFHESVPISYEPITRSLFDEFLWIPEAMAFLGYNQPDFFEAVRTYINDLRSTFGTDWAFATFQVDASNDADGLFTNGYGGWSYFGGPHNIVAYDDSPGALAHNALCAHENAHNFYAWDEYQAAQIPCDARNGYFNWENQNSDYPPGACALNTNCIMDNYVFLCTETRRQVGWRDGDGDQIPLILDTNPETSLNPPTLALAGGTTASYTGGATVSPYPNENPFGQGHDITLNTIAGVEYRIDGGAWTAGAPSDGDWDSGTENFEFTTPPLAPGAHIVEARAVNSVGNADTTAAADTLLVDPTAVPVGASTRPFALQLEPNPATASVRIAYSVPAASVPARIAVHDVTGRRVWSADAPAGVASEITWTGTDEKGRRLGSGTYFVTVRAGARSLTERLILIR
jgi:hypothetical protein